MKFIYLSYWILLISLNSSAQKEKLRGLYKENLAVESPYGYFYDNHFIWFNIQYSPVQDDGKYIISEIGSGDFSYRSNEVELNFTKERNNVSAFRSPDSIQCVFRNNMNDDKYNININFHFKNNHLSWPSVEIKTFNMKRTFNAVSDMIFIQLPTSDPIIGVTVYATEYQPRVIPVNEYFNDLKCDLYLNSYHNPIYITSGSKKLGMPLMKVDQKALEYLYNSQHVDSSLNKLISIIGLGKN